MASNIGDRWHMADGRHHWQMAGNNISKSKLDDTAMTIMDNEKLEI